MVFLPHGVAPSPRSEAPARSPWPCCFCGCTGSMVKALGCQFIRPICLWRYWSQELDGALFFILKAKRCMSVNIWELQMSYMDLLNSKGIDNHSVWLKLARTPAYWMKMLDGMAPVIRGITEFMFLCFLNEKKSKILSKQNSEQSGEKDSLVHRITAQVREYRMGSQGDMPAPFSRRGCFKCCWTQKYLISLDLKGDI